MRQDRFLLGILIFIAALVAAAVVLFFVNRAPQSYQSDDTPAGVVHNYTLAVLEGDYERAYGYLAEGDGKPTFSEFQTGLPGRDEMASNGLRIEQAAISGDEAGVDLAVVYAATGLFATESSRFERASLALQDGAWKLNHMPYPYWNFEWYSGRMMP